MSDFKFRPYDYVMIKPLECRGRIGRCIITSGPIPVYSTDYFLDGKLLSNEFYEDELENILT